VAQGFPLFASFSTRAKSTRWTSGFDRKRITSLSFDSCISVSRRNLPVALQILTVRRFQCEACQSSAADNQPLRWRWSRAPWSVPRIANGMVWWKRRGRFASG
jgi:hypothetical protein